MLKLPDLSRLRLPDPRRAAVRLAEARLPAPAVKLASLLPQLPPSLALATGLNLALGQGVAAIPAALQGRQVRFVITDAGLDLCLELGPEGFRPAGLPRVPCDATITATRRDFVALALREEDSDTLFFTRRLVMEGDTEVGLLVRNLLDAVDVERLGLRAFAPWRAAAQAHRLLRARSPGRLVLW
jgi:predicted lipid carrier protein YhbT